jgi:hypothetical protein
VRVFPINTYDRYESSNPNNHEPPMHLGLRLIRCCATKTSSSRSLTCSCESGRAGLQNRRPQRSCTGRVRIRFLEAIFVTARLLHQALHHGSSTSSSDVRRWLSPSTRTSSGRLPSSSNHRRQGTASHVWFILSNHVLHIQYLDLRRHTFAR